MDHDMAATGHNVNTRPTRLGRVSGIFGTSPSSARWTPSTTYTESAWRSPVDPLSRPDQTIACGSNRVRRHTTQHLHQLPPVASCISIRRPGWTLA